MSATAADHRPHRTWASLLGAPLLSTLLLACGGGDDLAPPVPVAQGSGMAVVSLDGIDLGPTQLVESGLSGFQDLVLRETAEALSFTGTPPEAQVSRSNLANDQIAGCDLVMVNAANPGTAYVAGEHYAIDFSTGLLTAIEEMGNPGVYLIPDGTDVLLDYCYNEPLFSVGVGVGFATGDFVGMTFFNLPAGASGMRTTSVVSVGAPLDGSFAFTVEAYEDLTAVNARRYIVMEDPANLATVISADLTNQLDPCIEGRVEAVLRDLSSGELVTLLVDFDDPVCP